MKQMKKGVCAAVALLLSVALLLGASAAVKVDDNIDRAMEFYRSELGPAFAEGGLTAEVWELICALQTGKADDPDYAFMVTEGPELTDKSMPSDYAKKLMALLLLGKDSSALAKELAAMQNDEGAFEHGEVALVTNTSFSLLALLAAKANGVETDFDCDKAVEAIIAQAKQDHGYNDYGEEGNVDTTGMVLLGLAAAKANGCQAADAAVDSAAGYIKSTLQDTGYFVGNGQYDTPNACSQAYAIIGLIAAGENMNDAKWEPSINVLLACQDVGGGFWYQEDRVEGEWPFTPDQMSTYEAIMAMLDYKNGESFLVSLAVEPYAPSSSQPTAVSSQAAQPAESSVSVSSAEASANVPSTNDGSSDRVNPKTGDEGINPLIWIVLGAAVVAVLVVALLPVFTKKKGKEDQPEQREDDNEPK